MGVAFKDEDGGLGLLVIIAILSVIIYGLVR